MEENRIDINTFITKLIEKTDHDDCPWETTSEVDKYKLSLASGDIIFNTTIDGFNQQYYDLTLKDSNNKAFAHYSASSTSSIDYIEILSKLSESIDGYFTRIRERKIADLYNELC